VDEESCEFSQILINSFDSHHIVMWKWKHCDFR
jgi:hypothetical protein